MDFFEHQEQARRKTGVLIFYFILAVLGIIAATYALAAGILMFVNDGAEAGGNPLWRPEVLMYTSLGTAGIVFLASAFKTAQLSGGGAVVARELGGRELDLNTTDYHERRLLNVVEEMAIASGVPVPTVFVMDSEDSINAFAAGKTTSDAVIGVTRGCMTVLTRDELQGVIAHEFSHILNGDMRLNIRLMGLLFGILFLALMGELILRFGVRGGMNSGRKEGAGMALVMLIAGLGLLAIGYLGNFFGNLIKASVSRQREFLADASAVQFTRNPDGLAGALMKIGGLKSGSTVSSPMARDASHLFFGSAFSSSLFATHPPLPTRIKRLLPHWDGKFSASRLPAITGKTDRNTSRISATPQGAGAVSMLTDESKAVALSQPEAVESMRTLHPEQVDLGQKVHSGLPAHWVESCHSYDGAQAMVLALLLAQDEDLRNSELKQLRKSVGQEVYDAVCELFCELGALHSTIKLSLVDLAIPTLRHLSRAEYATFRAVTDRLIASDRQVDLFEFALLKVVHRHLDAYFEKAPPPRIKYRKFSPLIPETEILLSTLAALSHPRRPDEIRSAFEDAAGEIRKSAGVSISFQPAEKCGLKEIEKALRKFDRASPLLKRQLLVAASRSVLADGAVSSSEAELIRAIADAIGCPIPPFVKTAPLLPLTNS
jgi:Zn-dependent protease with chaperone function